MLLILLDSSALVVVLLGLKDEIELGFKMEAAVLELLLLLLLLLLFEVEEVVMNVDVTIGALMVIGNPFSMIAKQTLSRERDIAVKNVLLAKAGCFLRREAEERSSRREQHIELFWSMMAKYSK